MNDWQPDELAWIDQKAKIIRAKQVSYYRACLDLIPVLKNQRSFEAIRTQLRKYVNAQRAVEQITRPNIMEMLVPPIPHLPAFEGRFCRSASGKTGICTGYKLVRDRRPDGKANVFRILWYGINYLTGRDWSSFEPKPLSTGELQKLTWAWGGVTSESGQFGPKADGEPRPTPAVVAEFGGSKAVSHPSSFLCNHANECPAQCTCPPECYCKSRTCKNG